MMVQINETYDKFGLEFPNSWACTPKLIEFSLVFYTQETSLLLVTFSVTYSSNLLNVISF